MKLIDTFDFVFHDVTADINITIDNLILSPQKQDTLS